MSEIQHVYEIRPGKDHRGFDLISDALPFGGLWYLQVGEAIPLSIEQQAILMSGFLSHVIQILIMIFG